MRQLGRSLAILGAFACALSAWLLAPVHRAAEGTPLHVCLVDASGSVTAPRTDWGAWARSILESEAEIAESAGRELVIVRFGRDLARVFGPAAAASLDARALDLEGADGSASDLRGALDLARSAAHGRSIAELVLLSEGSFTGARPDSELARVAGEGARLTWREPPAPDRADVALVSLRLPPDPEPGAPLACIVEGLYLPAGAEPPLHADDVGDAEIDLRVLVEDAAGTRSSTRRVRVPASETGAWTARLELGIAQPGLTRIECRATLLHGTRAGDPLPGNDSLEAVLRAGEVRVVLVSAAPEQEGAADTWVASTSALEGLQFVRVRPAQLASWLPGADLLVSFDLSERSLFAAHLSEFVERGGGWLGCGGLALLAGRLGPLTPLAPAAEEQERRRVLLLVDGSGSMQGAAFEGLRTAILRLLSLAPADATFELAFFTDHIEAGHDLPVDDPAGAARALLAARAPGGPTDLLAALEPLEDRARGAAGGLLVFLLSDGREQPSDSAAQKHAHELLGRLAAAGCEVVPVAMGPEADAAALGLWCATDSDVLVPDDSDALFLALRDRASRDWARSARELGVRPASEPARSAAARELQQALAEQVIPPIERHLRARPARPAVDVLLETLEGQPLLVIESHGAGTVAALACLPADDWAAGWSRRPELLAPLLRALARGRDLHRPRLALEGGELVLRGVPADWPARVWIRTPEPPPERALERTPEWTLALPPSASGEDPLSVRRGPGPHTWAPSLTLMAGPGPGAAVLARLPLARQQQEEESRLPARRVDRRALPRSVGPRPAAALGRRDSGPWVLALGLAGLAAAAFLGWERPRTLATGSSRN